MQLEINYDKNEILEGYLNTINYGGIFGIENAADLNQAVSKAKVCELINLAEAHYDGQLAKIAEDITSSKKKIKLVLIAGPSSAGKTTTSKKLDIYLRSKGFITHPIALDDYFTDMEKRELDENGNPKVDDDGNVWYEDGR